MSVKSLSCWRRGRVRWGGAGLGSLPVAAGEKEVRRMRAVLPIAPASHGFSRETGLYGRLVLLR